MGRFSAKNKDNIPGSRSSADKAKKEGCFICGTKRKKRRIHREKVKQSVRKKIKSYENGENGAEILKKREARRSRARRS